MINNNKQLGHISGDPAVDAAGAPVTPTTTGIPGYFPAAGWHVELTAPTIWDGGGGGGTGTVTSVGFSTGTTGLSVSGINPITTSGTFTLGGTLAVANGGTGATTAAGAAANILPLQTGNANKVLMTDGFGNLSWATAGSGTVTSVTTTLSGISIATNTTTPAISGTLGVTSGGTGTATQFTAGSIVFAGSSGVYTQDNANLFWGDTNNQLFVGAQPGSLPPTYSLSVEKDAVIGGLNIGLGWGQVSTNTVVGKSSLDQNTTGSNLTSIGNVTLFSNTTGSRNTAIGSGSLFSNATGDNNTAVGFSALSNARASNNTAIGQNAGDSIISGANNTIVGCYLGTSNMSGQVILADGNGNIRFATNSSGALSFDNVSFGAVGDVLQSNGPTAAPTWVANTGPMFTPGSVIFAGSTGRISENSSKLFWSNSDSQLIVNGNAGVLDPNVSLVVHNDAYINGLTVGLGAGQGATNTAVGNSALAANAVDANITGVGVSALSSNTTGVNNTAVGGGALFSNTIGMNNVAVGTAALQDNINGSSNVAVGSSALLAATGSGNIGIGVFAAQSMVTGSNNIYIGASSAASLGTPTREIVIGASISGKGTNTTYIGGTLGSYQGNNSSTWATTSDARVKKNVRNVEGALDTVCALRPVHFEYIVSGKSDTSFIAQEYMQVLPDQVHEHAASEEEKAVAGVDTIYGLNANLVPYLVKAIQELKAKNDELTATVEALKEILHKV